MNSADSIKRNRTAAQLVGVIASVAALACARRLRRTPDFFELRLDALHKSLGQIEAKICSLQAPIILTARHPKEGGEGNLSLAKRVKLLQRFLDCASLVDLELRSAGQMSGLLADLRRRKIGLLLSCHCLKATPAIAELHRLTNRAAAFHPAVFKLATRTDYPAQLERLTVFLSEAGRYSFPIAVMGIGKLGFLSRRRFDRAGCALTYASLGPARIEGQPSLNQLRRARHAYH